MAGVENAPERLVMQSLALNPLLTWVFIPTILYPPHGGLQ